MGGVRVGTDTQALFQASGCVTSTNNQRPKQVQGQTQNQGVGKWHHLFSESCRFTWWRTQLQAGSLMQLIFHAQYITPSLMILRSQKSLKKTKSSRGQALGCRWRACTSCITDCSAAGCDEQDQQFKNFSLHWNPWRCFFFLKIIFVLPKILYTQMNTYKLHVPNVKNNKSEH